jgi:STE24 endopeptidase
MALTLTTTFVTLLIVTTIIRVWLGLRHVAHVQKYRNQVPVAFEGSISLEAHQKAAGYSSAKTRLVIIEATAQAALLALLTLGGGLQWIDDIWRSILTNQEIIRGALVICTAMIVSSVVELPFDYYKTFVVDERFGFNKMTRTMFISDMIKGTILSVAIGTPILIAALWLMQSSGQYWWFYLWLAFVCYFVFLQAIAPILIAPFFNKFTPLTDENLKQRLRLYSSDADSNHKGCS